MQRCARRSAQKIKARSKKRPCQPKTAKRFFGGPGSQGPSGQAKERTRILPVRRGFFVRRAAPYGRLAVLARPAAVVAAFVYGAPAFFCRYAAALFPACGLSDTSALGLVCAAAACHALVRAFFLLSFAFFRLTFASQISFHLSLRPRRASTFFRKESRQRFAKGLRPFEPHSCALRPFFPSSALLAGLVRPEGPQTAGWHGKRPKSQRSKAQLFGRFCAWGNGWPHVLRIHGSLARAFSLPGRTGAQRGPTPGKNRGRARLGTDTNPVRDLLTAGVLTAGVLTAGVRRRVRR